MKLKNIFLAGLATMLFTNSCSKDDDGAGMQKGNAKLNIKILASSAKTKATTDETLPGEENINNVAVLVFSEDGTELLGAPYWSEVGSTDGTATILNVESSSRAIAKIVIVANCSQNAFSGVTTYPEMQSRLAQLSEQNVANLTMSSQVITTRQPLNAGDNYLGYETQGNNNINGISRPVELTRLPARLDLIGVTTAFAKTKLDGRSVRINSVYVVNQKKASRFFSEDYWGVVMTGGNLENSSTTNINKSVSDNAALTNVVYRHYVMENDGSNNTPTQLVINATLEAFPGYEAETKSFAATVNLNGANYQGVFHKYVKRNYVYRIRLNFTGNSFTGDPHIPPVPPVPPVPDTGELDVKVEVAGWGPVTQEVEIE